MSYALIAEFDPQQTAIYRQAVERHGLETVLFRGVGAARRVLQARGAPMLLIAELAPPDADGFSLIADLRRTASPDRAAIVVLSAHAELRAAAGHLRAPLGIAEIADVEQPAQAIIDAIDRTVAGVARAHPQGRTREADALLHKILFRTAQAFRSPLTLLSIERHGQRSIVGHLAVDELRESAPFWAVLSQMAVRREAVVVSNLGRQGGLPPGASAPSNLGVRAFAAVPLVSSADRFVGALSLLYFRPHTLSALQLDLLNSAARRIADELAAHYEDDLARDLDPWRSREGWAQLERLALTDRLTGLSNRHAGELALERELARARRTGAPVSLALIDIDHFKEVNDRFGHLAGDDVLKQLSRILTSTFRASDLAVRWGGDEFLVLLPDVSVGGAAAFAERARTQFEKQSFPGIGQVTLSVGVVQVGRDEDVRSAVRRADVQLYDAKGAGRNIVRADAPAPQPAGQ